ncbi:alpha/beta fold hydrolase [Nesterenkonia sp. HG001]|uniref:alpha/beta fold hydrolase n=1 Tax=Nesterenkonia sp. HG001 TaxID=2983207 RepID=UPI002AC49D1D|nr:alpha/beta fold hydrolase [Nesterenkonia sp. HG001]MDZ5078028.1 alpha/beta hydrolase [Nesterenkonia sp. HG001]
MHHTPSPARTLLDGTRLVEHRLQVPLDHADPGAEQLQLFAREFVSAEAAERGPEQVSRMPWLLYLQGGPGGKGVRPARLPSWMQEAGRRFRILMLDQRGTGLSTPLTRHHVLRRGRPAEQAAHLRHFRADSIVRDAEAFRRHLGLRSWSVLGQSFGGFCTLTYLSAFPESLDRALITGGLAPLTGHADQVYRATYTKMAARNREHFSRFPEDRERLDEVVDHLRRHEVRLPDGSPLTVPRLQMLGMLLGGNTRADLLHFLLEEAFDAAGPDVLSDTFLSAVHQQISFAAAPMYALMHESIYGQPADLTEGRGATGWAAERILEEHPEFSPAAASPLLTGEMILRHHVALDPVLAPLADAADRLAAVEDWTPLYDTDRLARNTVPAAAAVYRDDVYVARELSLETAAQVAGLSVWETAEHHHDGLHDDGARILRELLHRTDAPAPLVPSPVEDENPAATADGRGVHARID